MTNLKLSSKMHVMIIVTAVVIAIGIAMGLIFEFASNGYFNYGADYSSYNSVVVNYAYIDGQEDSVKDICDKAFKNAGVSYYTCTAGDTEEGGQLVYKFSASTDAKKLTEAKDAIDGALTGDDASGLSNASVHESEAVHGGTKAFTYGAIALASAVVFQFIYFVIRYGLTCAFGALLADVHNLAIFISLLAISRVPVGSTVVAFGALTVVMTMIGCAFLFERVRKNAKDESLAKLDAFGLVDLSANESVANIAVSAVAVAAAAVVLFVLMAISALAVEIIVTPAIMALLCAASSVYGTAFFTPAVYSRFKLIGDNFKASHSQKVKKS